MIYQPIISIIAFIHFWLPIKTDNVPFLTQNSEKYIVQWFSRPYFILIKQLQIWAHIFIIYLVSYKENDEYVYAIDFKDVE